MSQYNASAMAALRFDIFTRAVVAALVLVALATVFDQAPSPARADGEDTLAGEWFFTIRAELVSSRQFPFTFEREGCIASMVEKESGWNVPMSCSGFEGYVQLTADIDQVGGAARFEGKVFGVEIEAKGTFEKGSRNCVDAMWRGVGAAETVDFTISGCQQRGGAWACTMSPAECSRTRRSNGEQRRSAHIVARSRIAARSDGGLLLSRRCER